MEYAKPIAIDLGAQGTGVWTNLYPAGAGADPAAAAAGYSLRINKDAMTFMMPQRTAARHMRRGFKRRKLAKRLVRLWVADRWRESPSGASEPSRTACEHFLMGLMNRRGFTYFSLEEKIQPEAIDAQAEALQTLGVPLHSRFPSDWLRTAAADPADAASTLEHKLFRLHDRKANKKRGIDSRTELTDHIKAHLPASTTGREIKAVVSAVKHLRECLQAACDASESGHKPRADYFKAVHTDLLNTELGKRTCRRLDMSAEQLTYLLGHIGNLDLRALRSYFHDSSRQTRKALDVARFHTAWAGFFGRWSLAGETDPRRKDNKRHALREWKRHLATAPDRQALWQLLTEHDPSHTIPPFESQSNRRPPVCQSLLLDPSALDRRYPALTPDTPPAWQIWAQNLARADTTLGDSVDDIAAFDARVIHRQIHPSKRAKGHARWRAARVLQRALDRSRNRDPWALRLLASAHGASHGAAYARAHAELQRAIGSQHIDGFLNLAKAYFTESRQARDGMWFHDDGANRDALLTNCHAHPPHKHKVLTDAVGGVLCTRLEAAQLERLQALIETGSVGPPAGLSGIRRARSLRIHGRLKSFAALQKEMGGDLRLLADDARQVPADERASWHKDENRARAWNAVLWAELIAARIGAELDHDDLQVARYANPYSLAQLHQLLYTDRGGFASNCRGCLLENHWRAQMDGDGRANASRLPADSVRPFDGMLARLLRTQARHIANAVADDLVVPEKATALSIPLILEENRFEFTEQLATLKGKSRRDIDKIAEAGQRRRSDWQQRWQDKHGRIRDAGVHLCPYCGKAIGSAGDFDHITSRAATRDMAGYAFDAEANLIFAHRHCNAAKGRKDYTLDNLAPSYLQAVFGRSDPGHVRNQIAAQTDSWAADKRDHRSFHQLPPELRHAVRHALFVPGLRATVLARIAHQNVARVNGTQRWFARQLASKLRKAFQRKGITVPLDFSVHPVPYTAVGELRQRLAQAAPELFAKPQPQPPYSHTVDAALVFALASTDVRTRQRLGLATDENADCSEFTQPERAAALLPQALHIHTIKRRPKHADHVKPWHQQLFKGNALGERYVPVGVDTQGRVWAGFGRDNRIELPAAKPGKHGQPKPDPRLGLLTCLWPVLRTPADMAAPDLAGLAEHAQRRADNVFWLKVRRPVAARYLLDHKRQPEDATVRALTCLRYVVQGADVCAALHIDDAANKAPAASALLKDGDFQIKLAFPKFGFSGLDKTKLLLPARSGWQALCDDVRLAPHLGQRKLVTRVPEAGLSDSRALVDWQAVVQTHFPAGKTDRSHRRKRQVHSLPRLARASGGFRARRVDPDGDPVYQLLQVEGSAYSGFAASKDKPGFDTSKAQLLNVLERSPSLAPLQARKRAEVVVPFDQPSILLAQAEPDSHGILRFALLPNTDGRRAARMTITWQGLQALLPGWQAPQSFTEVQASLELTASQSRVLAETLQTVFGIASLGPRISNGKGKLEVEHLCSATITLYWGGGQGAGKKKTDTAGTGPADKARAP